MDRTIAMLKACQAPALFCHASPDGDTLGSALALARALVRLGKSCRVCCRDAAPPVHQELPGAQDIVPPDVSGADLLVFVDAATPQLLDAKAVLDGCDLPKLVIDHHASNSLYGDHNYVDPVAGAAGVMMLRVIDALGVPLDREMAECLYVAISTDTGGFRFSNTTAETHRAAARLLEVGIDVAEISERIFSRRSLAKSQLMGVALERIDLFAQGQAAGILLMEADYQRCGAADSDTEGLVNLAQAVEGVEVAYLMRPGRAAGQWKVSLRTRKRVDASALAAQFGGGGHNRAAGLTLKDAPYQALEAQLRRAIEIALAGEAR